MDKKLQNHIKESLEYNIEYTGKFNKSFRKHIDQLGLCAFSYFRITDKKCTYENAFWSKDDRLVSPYFDNKLEKYILSKNFFAPDSERVFVPWIAFNENPLFEILKEYGWANGISIYQRIGDDIIVFLFGADSKNKSVYDLFVNKRYLLDQLLLHFYCEKDRLEEKGFEPPWWTFQGGFTPDFRDYETQHDDPNIYQTLPKKIPVSYNGVKNYLSHKTIKAVGLIARGRSVKEAAIELDISPRTIESQLDALKQKYNLGNKFQIINLWEENRILHALID
ncbi:MAG: helix-turn-helix transcriptional regulator [Alphaproteobacteria bacterium]